MKSPLPPIPFNQIQCADLRGWDGETDAPGWRKVEGSIATLTGGAGSAANSQAGKGTAQKRVSICVLPFANMSGDPEQEYFSDGISEDIITDLSKISALSVVARNTAFRFKGKEIDVKDVGAVTARERPDVALVGLGRSSEHALALIDRIVKEAACPVILLIHAPDPPFVKEASKRGIFAYITDSDVDEWQSAIDIVLRRFAEYHDLEGAFGRRAVTERAKGILMERHSVDDADVFEMLRDQSRRTNTKLADVAAAVVDGHRLLPMQPDVSQTTR